MSPAGLVFTVLDFSDKNNYTIRPSKTKYVNTEETW